MKRLILSLCLSLVLASVASAQVSVNVGFRGFRQPVFSTFPQSFTPVQTFAAPSCGTAAFATSYAPAFAPVQSFQSFSTFAAPVFVPSFRSTFVRRGFFAPRATIVIR